MKLKSPAAFVAAAATLVIGIAVPVFIGSDAGAKETTQQFTVNCYAKPSIGNAETRSPKMTIVATYPTKVTVGKQFDITLSTQVSDNDVSNLTMGAKMLNLSRMKTDFTLPTNVEIQGMNVDTSGSVRNASAYRVKDDGSKDSNGRFIRLASYDNKTIGNGPHPSTSSEAGAMLYPSNGVLRQKWPVLTLHVKATAVGKISMGIRDTGRRIDDPTNFSTFLAHVNAPFVNDVWVPTWCKPSSKNDASKAQNLINVTAEPRPPARPTTITIKNSDALAAEAGTTTAVTATLHPADAAGTVIFTSGNQTKEVQVSEGSATGYLKFDSIGSATVSATFKPTDPLDFIAPDPVQATVNVSPKQTTLKLHAPKTAFTDSTVAVTAEIDEESEANGGTVNFTTTKGTLGNSGPVTVDGGQATTALTLPEDAGDATVTAHFHPKDGSALAEATKDTTITVNKAEATSVILSLSATDAFVADEVTATATVIPYPSTEPVGNGTIRFTVGGISYDEVVTDNTQVTITAAKEGDTPVTATFIPAEGNSQTRATSTKEIFTVKKAAETTLSAHYEAATTSIIAATDPAAAGTYTVTIDGRSVTAQTDGSEQTIPVTLAPTSTSATVTFTPENPHHNTTPAPQTVTGLSTGNGLTIIGEPTITLPSNTPTTADAHKAAVFSPTVQGVTGIGGYITLDVDNQPVKTADGREAKVKIIDGEAPFGLKIEGNGPHEVAIKFYDTDGTLRTTKRTTVTVSGGAEQ